VLGLTNDAIAAMFGRPRERREILHEFTLHAPRAADLIGKTAAATIKNTRGKVIVEAGATN